MENANCVNRVFWDHVVPTQKPPCSTLPSLSCSSPLGSEPVELFPSEENFLPVFEELNYDYEEANDKLCEMEKENKPLETNPLDICTKGQTSVKEESIVESHNNESRSSKPKRKSALKAEKNLRDIAESLTQIPPIEKKGTVRKVEKKKSSLQHVAPSPSSLFSDDDMDEEKMKKMEKNRQSARDCRKRKKMYIQGLEKKVLSLENELSIALEEIRLLRNRLQKKSE